jgi:menaquinone-dependent protoporphyrinogen IX oxidase
MKLIIYTKDNGPESRSAIELGTRVADEGYTVDFVDLEEETRQDVEVYDIYVTPAVAIAKDDGGLVEIWRGEVPTESEVKNFLRM